MGHDAAVATGPAPVDRAFIGLLGRAAVVGPVAAAAATAFVVTEHELTSLIWEHLPTRLGFSEVPWWWAVAMLSVGALLTALALGLPGHGGHSPLDGFAFDVGPRVAVSAVAAALASLSFGAVLGPEAPALAIGTATGFVVAGIGKVDPSRLDGHRRLLMMAGGMAAFGAVLGNPIALAVFILEAALVARRTAGAPLALAPVALALATGYLVQVGVGQWAGLGEVVLALPTAPAYPTVLAADILVAVPLGLAVAVIIHVAFLGGGRMAHAMVHRPRVLLLVLSAWGIAGLALMARALVDAPLNQVLFSGQATVGGVLTATSASSLLVVVIAKSLAYSISLGSGFRGGAVFPAISIGVGVAVVAALVVGPASVTGLAAAGVAAAVAAVIRLPFSSALLATLLLAQAGLAVTSPALVGAVVGLLTVLVLDRRLGPRLVGPTHPAD